MLVSQDFALHTHSSFQVFFIEIEGEGLATNSHIHLNDHHYSLVRQRFSSVNSGDCWRFFELENPGLVSPTINYIIYTSTSLVVVCKLCRRLFFSNFVCLVCPAALPLSRGTLENRWEGVPLLVIKAQEHMKHRKTRE